MLSSRTTKGQPSPRRLELVPDRGKIPACAQQDCGHRCCQFEQGNFIAIYPGELQEAKSLGYKLEHLRLIGEDTHGGQRAVCVASNCADCDGGYKPLDCASYPLFPGGLDDHGSVARMIRGEKCPLQETDFAAHLDWVSSEWSRICRKRPELAHWVAAVDLVGYVPITNGVERER